MEGRQPSISLFAESGTQTMPDRVNIFLKTEILVADRDI